MRPGRARCIRSTKGWRFFFKSENTSDNARHVTLPHTWNTDPRSAGGWLETTGNYQNDIYIPGEWASRRLFVKFYGAQSVADLFVNGRHAGTHRGGAAAFAFEITDYVRFGEDNALLVVVSNGVRDDVLPTSTDMNLYGGIYRDVELVVTGRTAVSPLYLGSDGVLVHPQAVDSLSVSGEAEIHLVSKEGNACMVTLDIAAPDGRPVFSKRQRARLDGKPVVVPFAFGEPEPWSPESPSLYTVTASIGEDSITDRVSVRTGFRSIVATPSGGLRINGRRISVRGVTLYHDNASSGGALTPEDGEADLAVLRDLGANALRSAVMPHSQRFYDRCDERGNSGVGRYAAAKRPLPGRHSLLCHAAVRRERTGTVAGDRRAEHQPPVGGDVGVFSCLRPRGDDVVPLTSGGSSARPVRWILLRPTVACSDQNGNINFVSDLIVWRQNVGWRKGSTDDVAVWRDQMRKNWSHLRSGVAYGGSGFIGHKSYTAQAEPRSNWMPEEKQTRFHEEYARNLQGDSLFWGVWIDNLFDYGSARRPYGVNGSGLVTLDRRDRKDAYYLYRALWNAESPTLYIADKHRRLRDVPRQAFRIYSSAGVPVLTVGGRHGGRDRVRRLPVPVRFGGRVGSRGGEGRRRAAARQRVYSSRQRAKTEAAAGPSAKSRSANDKLASKGIRSENTWT